MEIAEQRGSNVVELARLLALVNVATADAGPVVTSPHPFRPTRPGELNAVTRDNQGNVCPLVPRSFASLSEAEEENGQSRIYLGIHCVR